jgi:hypothetical protein
MQTLLELQGRWMVASKRGYVNLEALTLFVTLLPVACVTCRYVAVYLLVLSGFPRSSSGACSALIYSGESAVERELNMMFCYEETRRGYCEEFAISYLLYSFPEPLDLSWHVNLIMKRWTIVLLWVA